MHRMAVLMAVEREERWSKLRELALQCVDEVHHAPSIAKATGLIDREAARVLVCDYDMPWTGKLIAHARIRSPFCSIIAVTMSPGMAKAVGAIDMGVWDYIPQPIVHSREFTESLNAAVARARRWLDSNLLCRPAPSVSGAMRTSAVDRAAREEN